jgi:hypothetical protein
MNSRPRRLLTSSCVAACVGLFAASGCFEDPLASLSSNNDDDTGDGDGDSGDGDGDTGDGDGDGDGDTGDGDGDSGDGDGDTGDGDGDGPCGSEEMDCGGGVCANIQTDSGNCGQCGHMCPGEQLCGEGMCKSEKYVFATEMSFEGNFGAMQPDVICSNAAMNALLPAGIYRAWVSNMAISPSQWLVTDGVFRLRGGDVVAYSRSDLLDGTLAAPINRTQNGELLTPTPACNGSVQFAVWTGTASDGSASGPDCSSWAINLDSLTGRVGDAMATDMNWSAAGNCTPSCATPLRIYCIQQ